MDSRVCPIAGNFWKQNLGSMFPCVLHNASYFSMLLWKQLGEIFTGLLNFVTSFCSLTRLPGGGNEKHAWNSRQSVVLISFWNSVISSPLLSIRWDGRTHGQACCFLGILGGQYLAFLGQRPHSMFLNYPTVGKLCVQKAVSKGLWNGCMNCSHSTPRSIWTHQTLVLVALHGSEAENSH